MGSRSSLLRSLTVLQQHFQGLQMVFLQAFPEDLRQFLRFVHSSGVNIRRRRSNAVVREKQRLTAVRGAD
jgi:hypothetical protein